MKKSNVKKTLLLILSSVLIAAMAFSVTGCGKKGTIESADASEIEEIKDALDGAFDDLQEAVEGLGEEVGDALEEASEEIEDIKADLDEAASGVTVLGEGATSFQFIAIDDEGNETAFEIHTDETTVGAALVALDLIAGDESEYGLYVKVVNGITADYDTDGAYWAFYIGDEYATAGVDATDIEEGAVYKFTYTKG